VQVAKQHHVVDKRISMKVNGFIHTLSISYDLDWNHICADVMEVFGLPGHRFSSHFTPKEITLYFKSKKDLELCKILLSEKLYC
jgi:hypothetical protein